jgi:uncharacterized protein (TIGR00295 family)
MIPNEQEAIEFHKRAGSNKEIIDHCKAVANVARKLADRFSEKGIKVDKESVYAAALLHDIGRTRTQTVHHGHIGAEIIREFGADEKIARIVSRHVGAGITEEEARNLGFPPGDYVPETLEEKIVCFADKIVGEGNQIVPLRVEIEKFRARGLDYHRLEALKASLASLLGEDPEKAVSRNSSS